MVSQFIFFPSDALVSFCVVISALRLDWLIEWVERCLFCNMEEYMYLRVLLFIPSVLEIMHE